MKSKDDAGVSSNISRFFAFKFSDTLFFCRVDPSRWVGTGGHDVSNELRAQRHLPGSAAVFERVSGDEAEARTNADGLIMAPDNGSRVNARRRFTRCG